MISLTPHCAFAQQTKVPRIGYLSNLSERGVREAAFLKGMRDLGYVEGRNFVIEWRFAKGLLERLPELAVELVRSKVDILATAGISAALAAKRATSAIPIVMLNASDDPVRQGLIASLARPGGNVTGLVDISPELAGKRLDLLKQLAPKTSRVAILWDPTSPAAAAQFKEAEIAAPKLGVQLQSIEVRRPDDLEAAYAAAIKGRANALLVCTYGFFNSHETRIVNLGNTTRLPAMYTNVQFVHAGGLIGYAPDIPDRHRRAATFVDKILKGAKPGDLPVEQPTRFELAINLKTAKALGITVPPQVLLQADKAIE